MSHTCHAQCLYYLAEKVGDDSVLTTIPEVPRSETLVRTFVRVWLHNTSCRGASSRAVAVVPLLRQHSRAVHLLRAACPP